MKGVGKMNQKIPHQTQVAILKILAEIAMDGIKEDVKSGRLQSAQKKAN